MNLRGSLKSISDTAENNTFARRYSMHMSLQCKVKLQQLYLNCIDISKLCTIFLVSFSCICQRISKGLKEEKVGENFIRKTYSNMFFIPIFCTEGCGIALAVKLENLIRVKNTCLQMKKEIK